MVNNGRCEAHTKQKRKQYDDSRLSSSERGYDHQWHKVRDHKANINPLCERCLKRGLVVSLDIVHHTEPVEARPELRLVMSNLESLCNECHDIEHKEDRWG